ncbi:MAG: CxxC-x17-CxxC domain-containing protein [Thermodesulfobacteriota bacterium]
MKSLRRDSKFGKKDSDRSGGGVSKKPSRGGFSRGGGRDSGMPAFDKQVYKAICDKCGATCQVPFKPAGDKPIFCRDCFRIMEVSESPRPRHFGSRKYPESRRSDNFKKSEYSESAKPDQFKIELDKINLKLDRILKVLEEE